MIWHWQYINRFYRRLTYSYVDQDAAQRQIEPAYIVQAQETYTPNPHLTFDTRAGFLQVICPLRYEGGVDPSTISAADIGLSTLKYAGQEITWIRSSWVVHRDVSVGIAYYHRTTQNVQTTANINAPLGDYTPTTVSLSGADAGKPIINPLTGASMTLYALTENSRTCAASSTQTDNGCGYTETTNNPAANQNHYNGLELTATRRPVGRWSALVGFAVQKDHGVQTTGDFNDPNLNLYRCGAIDQDSEFVVRADITYTLPYRFQTSLNHQHETGFPITPTNSFSGLAPGQITETVNLGPNGTLRSELPEPMPYNGDRMQVLRSRTWRTRLGIVSVF